MFRLDYREEGELLHVRYVPAGKKHRSHYLKINHKKRLIDAFVPETASQAIPRPLYQAIFPFIFFKEKLGVFMHCMSVRVGKAGFAFVGFSGAGKSTLANLFHQYGLKHPEKRIKVLNDETCLIDSKHNVWGTPWSGSAGFAENQSAPLRAVFFHEKSKTNRIGPVKKQKAFVRYLQCLKMLPNLKGPMEYCQDFILDLMRAVPHYEFKFARSPSAVRHFLSCLDKGDFSGRNKR